ncbi:MAG: winged helix-turn-helix domain-containing protein [Burkholderiales bacterium]|nr:winged helix-turn-helix domain-containing protein [Burkholderiales bacterium]
MEHSNDVLSFAAGRIRLDCAKRTLVTDGRPAKLGGRAFDLLEALVARRDRVVPKQELLDVVWPGLVVEENNLQVHVVTLRKLLGPQSIATAPGRG